MWKIEAWCECIDGEYRWLLWFACDSEEYTQVRLAELALTYAGQWRIVKEE
jgi:hypothetical protein